MEAVFSCSVREADFDPGAEIETLRRASPGAGALVSFCGVVRERDEQGAVHRLQLEHYPGMTEKALEALIVEARRRWTLAGARVVHRIGALRPRQNIVLVAVAAAHRREAFCACEFLIDALKTRAPLWKKSCGEQGERWTPPPQPSQSQRRQTAPAEGVRREAAGS